MKLIPNSMGEFALQVTQKKLTWHRKRNICPNREYTWPVNLRSELDGLALAGWAHRRPDQTQGTVFLIHAFMGNSMEEPLLRWGWHFAVAHKFAVTGIDLRGHGLSGDALPTLGEAESHDVSAFLTEAEKYNSPKPWILLGHSLGAMTAQRLAITDKRVNGAILIHPPGWPWDAVGKKLQVLTPAFGAALALAYGSDVLTKGDIRCYSGHPCHEPKVLYVMGDMDEYDYRTALSAYNHWYPNSNSIFNESPAMQPFQKKWFVLVPGAAHPNPSSNAFTLLEWGGMLPLFDEFVASVRS